MHGLRASGGVWREVRRVHARPPRQGRSPNLPPATLVYGLQGRRRTDCVGGRCHAQASGAFGDLSRDARHAGRPCDRRLPSDAYHAEKMWTCAKALAAPGPSQAIVCVERPGGAGGREDAIGRAPAAQGSVAGGSTARSRIATSGRATEPAYADRRRRAEVHALIRDSCAAGRKGEQGRVRISMAFGQAVERGRLMAVANVDGALSAGRASRRRTPGMPGYIRVSGWGSCALAALFPAPYANAGHGRAAAAGALRRRS